MRSNRILRNIMMFKFGAGIVCIGDGVGANAGDWQRGLWSLIEFLKKFRFSVQDMIVELSIPIQ